jgi:hypothetical protein
MTTKVYIREIVEKTQKNLPQKNLENGLCTDFPAARVLDFHGFLWYYFHTLWGYYAIFAFYNSI